ncbi:MAG: hypothetical protein JXQ87_00950 [Bacteroidia bacterium]
MKSIITLFALLLSLSSFAQDFTGLWEFVNVDVGEKTMTPQAKWTRINADGSYQSGNGWLQNSEGTWTFDKKESLFTPFETNGLKDPFGGFKISFEGELMKWERQEEGMNVVVTLKKIEALPKAPADMIVGLWELDKVEGEDKNGRIDNVVFIRWDRLYNYRNDEGERLTGYWHTNGHRPEVTFKSHNGEFESQTWNIIATEKQLILTGVSVSNYDLVLTFNRLDNFPE